MYRITRPFPEILFPPSPLRFELSFKKKKQNEKREMLHSRGYSGEVEYEALEIILFHLLHASAGRECEDGTALRIPSTWNNKNIIYNHATY